MPELDKWKSELCQEVRDVVEKVRDDLVALCPAGCDEMRMKSLFRGFHTVAGTARQFRLAELESIGLSLEQVVARLRWEHRRMDGETLELLLEGTDVICDLVDAWAQGSRCLTPPDFRQRVFEATGAAPGPAEAIRK
ncbi:Hpt domain-containing protein [Geomesophilobacter sediminis]|uniref:Hpt domain-containing protein n=1 Tax=Geomesophilobacter sediminis TaxID=2798584 RepID=A0A8J7INR8_9BACT|nr:Hpt domain-containing protein [Geomesophilobacter sediminis]MBJ6723784.1 Hpt domain-containing protein [Geomesophilobacter sediminis]